MLNYDFNSVLNKYVIRLKLNIPKKDIFKTLYTEQQQRHLVNSELFSKVAIFIRKVGFRSRNQIIAMGLK